MQLFSKLNFGNSKRLAVITFCASIVSYSNLFGQTSAGLAPQPSLFFLTVAPDARSAGMGEAGVAITPDANATYWNAAKLPFAEKDLGASISYTPWLRNLVDNRWLGYATGYKKIGKGQVVAASLNYYNNELIDLQNSGGSANGHFRSNEYAFAGTYAAKLGKNFSMGITLKMIRSNLAGNTIVNSISLQPGRTAAIDLSAFYKRQLINDIGGKKLDWSFGAVLSNFGGKISYGSGAEPVFIPTTLKIGGAMSFSPNTNHQFNVVLDASKLATPTLVNGVNTNLQPAIPAFLSSFSDAPGGFKEEMQEVVLSGGMEYKFKNTFALRAGYFGENKNKGGRKYFTAGGGARFLKNYDVDFSYLFPIAGNSPLRDTFRISLSMYLDPKSKVL